MESVFDFIVVMKMYVLFSDDCSFLLDIDFSIFGVVLEVFESYD